MSKQTVIPEHRNVKHLYFKSGKAVDGGHVVAWLVTTYDGGLVEVKGIGTGGIIENDMNDISPGFLMPDGTVEHDGHKFATVKEFEASCVNPDVDLEEWVKNNQGLSQFLEMKNIKIDDFERACLGNFSTMCEMFDCANNPTDK